jgi:hypothetical protein
MAKDRVLKRCGKCGQFVCGIVIVTHATGGFEYACSMNHALALCVYPDTDAVEVGLGKLRTSFSLPERVKCSGLQNK